MQQNLEQGLKTGTTTVGLIAANAVVLAADQRATMGHLASEEDFKKLYKITDNLGVSIAGAVGDALTLVRFLRSQAKLYEMERETPLSTKAAITFLSNVLSANRYYPYLSYFIMGGFNKGAELYTTDMVGGFSEVEKFTSVGSGFELAYGVLEHNYRDNMDQDSAIRLAVNAVKVAKKRDIYTGGEGIKVFVIDAKGARELSEKEVEKYSQ